MARYITPSRYRYAGDGLLGPNDSSVEDYELEMLIDRAEAAIDAYMAFPTRLQNGFAPGIYFMQEPFYFRNRKNSLPIPPVPARQVTRLRVHISNVGSTVPISGGAATAQGLYAILDPGEIVLNNDDQYGETISLTLTYSLSSVIWELGLDPPILEVDLETGYYLPHYGEKLYNMNGDLMLYRARAGYWASTFDMAPSILPNQLPSVPPLIYKNGQIVNATLLTAPLVAGTSYTSIQVAPLLQAAASGATFTINGSNGLNPQQVYPNLTVTLSAPASAGATTLSITSVTPVANYPAAAIPSWYATGMTTQNLPWLGNLNGAYLTQGCALDYTEGTVSFYNSGTPSSPIANSKTDIIQADYTGTIPSLVNEATISQVTYLLAQRRLNQLGAAGLELVKNGQQEIRRAKSDDMTEDGLCARARMKLSRYVSIALA
jgi:hypothetical protein